MENFGSNFNQDIDVITYSFAIIKKKYTLFFKEDIKSKYQTKIKRPEYIEFHYRLVFCRNSQVSNKQLRQNTSKNNGQEKRNKMSKIDIVMYVTEALYNTNITRKKSQQKKSVAIATLQISVFILFIKHQLFHLILIIFFFIKVKGSPKNMVPDC